jgi:8-oxo-dGTP pyrophosphatase MutT (NUDIX family)
MVGSRSVVGIATAYGLDGTGIESRWGRGFPRLSRPALRPTQPPVNGYRVFPGGKVRPGRDADLSPPSSAQVKNRVEL